MRFRLTKKLADHAKNLMNWPITMALGEFWETQLLAGSVQSAWPFLQIPFQKENSDA